MDRTKEACFEGLAPEVKAFLAMVEKNPSPPLSMETYQAARRFIATQSKARPKSEFAGQIDDATVAGPGGAIPVRIYTPEDGRPLPVLFFYHGGAWIVGNLDMDDHVCRSLAARTPCIVVSVDYRLAPEHPFPAGLDDCYTVLEWAAGDGNIAQADPRRLAVSGGSAGANLATAVAMMSRDRKGPGLAFQLLFYPPTEMADYATGSFRDFSDGFFLSKEDMETARNLYVPKEAERRNPYVSPLLAPDLAALPPALVITAGCDPLRDEGEAYAKRLERAGVPATYVCYEDMIHAFLYLFKRAGSTQKTVETAATLLKRAFGSGSR